MEGFPSNGSMEIFINRAWKHLCIANWDNTERNLVCQAQGYNGSTLEVDWQGGTNSTGTSTDSCKQLKQTCQVKTNQEIKCSGNKRFLCPQNESKLMRMWIDRLIIIAVLTLP